jgi:hypothetical protein
LFHIQPAPWALKGGYALELRFKTARSTIDIDLSMEQQVLTTVAAVNVNQTIREMLQGAAAFDLKDWFSYTIGAPIMDLDAAPYGGARYPIEAGMDARTFSRFHLDVGIGDALMHPLETLECRDWLQFAGIGRPSVPAISREQQFAEKLHAYSLPRSSPNSRVKDLVDLTLLIESGTLVESKVREAVGLTFGRRKTHDIPTELSPPPDAWEKQFTTIAIECRITTDMTDAFALVQSVFVRLVSGLQT